MCLFYIYIIWYDIDGKPGVILRKNNLFSLLLWKTDESMDLSRTNESVNEFVNLLTGQLIYQSYYEMITK